MKPRKLIAFLTALLFAASVPILANRCQSLSDAMFDCAIDQSCTMQDLMSIHQAMVENDCY